MRVLNMNTEISEKRNAAPQSSSCQQLVSRRILSPGVLFQDSMRIKESKFDMEIRGPVSKLHAQQPWDQTCCLALPWLTGLLWDYRAPSIPSNWHLGWTTSRGVLVLPLTSTHLVKVCNGLCYFSPSAGALKPVEPHLDVASSACLLHPCINRPLWWLFSSTCTFNTHA